MISYPNFPLPSLSKLSGTGAVTYIYGLSALNYLFRTGAAIENYELSIWKCLDHI